ncbi:hypothetical protein PI124_g12548 [Phytophthora idaei]|nr:hypothetical protein PI125_g12083 [Phytophthora idaei]KAG3172330.1 hypothetical protein PI126_g1461 [Phytophthora idaei]KAG3242613.1 hypothetical protein PI124_g12548 [Phytophthora idaei]
MSWWLLDYLWEWKVTLLGKDVSTVACVVTTTFIWVSTTPIRDVMLVFACRVYKHGANVIFFPYTCGERYIISARRPETLKLNPEEYACAMLAMVFIVPIAVLRDYKQRLGAG